MTEENHCCDYLSKSDVEGNSDDFFRNKTPVCIIFVLSRDSRLMSIGGGADEVMLGIISKYMDTLPKK